MGIYVRLRDSELLYFQNQAKQEGTPHNAVRVPIERLVDEVRVLRKQLKRANKKLRRANAKSR